MIRLSLPRPFGHPYLVAIVVAVVMILVLATCGSDDEPLVNPSPSSSEVPPPATDQPVSTTVFVRPTDPPPVTSKDVETPSTTPVSDLFDGGGPREAVLVGAVVADAASTRICEALLESYPAQCGHPWVVVADPHNLAIAFDTAQGVSWTPGPVEIPVTFDGNRVFVGDPDELVATTTDQSAIEALVAFAINPTSDMAAAIPFADGVSLALGGDTVVEQTPTVLANPVAWRLDVEEYDGYAGPFSALSTLATGEPTELLIGAHNRCVAGPTPAPAGAESLRRVSVQPSDADGCLEWFAVDVFTDPEGRIHAIDLQLFGP